MQEIFLKLIQHPLLWVFLATGGVFLFVVVVLAIGRVCWWLFLVPRRDRSIHRARLLSALDFRGWWQDHYVIVVIGAGLVMIAVAFHYYLIDIIRSVRLIVAQLVALLSET